MATIAWSAFYPSCLAELPGIPQPMLDHWLRKAAIELCERSKSWVADLAPMDAVANQMDYAMSAPAGSKLADIRFVHYQGAKIEPKSPTFLEDRYGDWQSAIGGPRYYTRQSSDSVLLVPAPNSDIAAAIKIKVSLRPTDDATGLDDWLYKELGESIAEGAKGKLMAMPDTPWANAGMAAFYLGRFETAVMTATASAANGFVRARPRSRPMFA